MASFIKYAGSKRAIAERIVSSFLPHVLLRKGDALYVEPFVGSGAVLLSLEPKRALISDTNANLMECYYAMVHDSDTLIAKLHRYEEIFRRAKTVAEFKNIFCDLRDAYNKVKHRGSIIEFPAKNGTKIAAMFIALNRTCFNGLYRENKSGDFNVPPGSSDPTKKEISLHIDGTRDVATVLKKIEFLDIRADNALKIIAEVEKDPNVVIYADPPYIPNKTSKFVSYGENVFSESMHRELAEAMHRCTTHYFYVSNSYGHAIQQIYKYGTIFRLQVSRVIAATGARRKKTSESFIVKNIRSIPEVSIPQLAESYVSGSCYFETTKDEHAVLAQITNGKNTGRLAESFCADLLESAVPAEWTVIAGKKICNNIPDFQITDSSGKPRLFIEVKSIGYFSNGTATDKYDCTVRKYKTLFRKTGVPFIIVFAGGSFRYGKKRIVEKNTDIFYGGFKKFEEGESPSNETEEELWSQFPEMKKHGLIGFCTVFDLVETVSNTLSKLSD